MLIIENVPADKCNCDGVILPRIGKKYTTFNVRGEEFCPRCECKYENRNTTTIKVVVIVVISVISCLVIYMIFLFLLDPLLGKRRVNYQEHMNEEDEIVEAAQIQMAYPAPSGSAGGSGGGAQGNVLGHLSQHQDKWKRQVKEQRKNIYDRHTMLN